jgi:hypothetical protein
VLEITLNALNKSVVTSKASWLQPLFLGENEADL